MKVYLWVVCLFSLTCVGYTCVHVHMGGQRTTSEVVPLGCLSQFCLRQGLSLAWNFASKLVFLSCQHPGASLSLPSILPLLGLRAHTTAHGFSHESWESNSDPHVWRWALYKWSLLPTLLLTNLDWLLGSPVDDRREKCHSEHPFK